MMKYIKIDEEIRGIVIEGKFNAPLEVIWAAWTQRNLLDQWWEPAPWKAETQSLQFKSGGHWSYAMKGPEGQKLWCRVDYKIVNPMRSFSATDLRCKENGEPDPEVPEATWLLVFTALKDTTHVDIVITFKTSVDLNKSIQLGFGSNFSAGLNNLNNWLAINRNT